MGAQTLELKQRRNKAMLTLMSEWGISELKAAKATLAKKAGVTESMVGQVLYGFTNFSPKVLETLREALPGIKTDLSVFGHPAGAQGRRAGAGRPRSVPPAPQPRAAELSEPEEGERVIPVRVRLSLDIVVNLTVQAVSIEDS